MANAKDITNTINQSNNDVDSEEIEAGEQYIRSKRPTFNFNMLEVPIGSEIEFTEDNSIKAKVVDDRKVSYNNEPAISLTKLTSSLLNTKWQVAPLPYWNYNGRNLSNIYDEVNPIDD